MEILKSELFKNFSKQEIEQLLNSNFIYQKSYKKTPIHIQIWKHNRHIRVNTQRKS